MEIVSVARGGDGAKGVRSNMRDECEHGNLRRVCITCHYREIAHAQCRVLGHSPGCLYMLGHCDCGRPWWRRVWAAWRVLVGREIDPQEDA